MRCGDEVMGATDAALSQRRRLAARVAFPAAYGVCPDIVLAVHAAAVSKPLDPIYDAHLMPLSAWLVAAVENPSRRGMMILALAAAQVLDGQPDAMLLSAGTDGIDGASDDAGAVVDGGTVSRAAWDGESAAASLRQADAGRCLEASGDLIHTGPTTTNVGDLLMGLKMSEAQWARLVA
jgi:hydroxypyruvate reductase